MGWKAPSDIIEAEGNNVDETYHRIADDQARKEALGIKTGETTAVPETPDENENHNNPKEKENNE